MFNLHYTNLWILISKHQQNMGWEHQMGPFDADYVVLKFDCPNCGHKVVSNTIHIPSPDFTAESTGDSQNWGDDVIICSNCKSEFEVDTLSDFTCSYVLIESIPDDYLIDVEEISEYDPYEEEAILSNREPYTNWKVSITNLRRLAELAKGHSEEIQKTQLGLVFIGVFSSLESYLSSTIINTVLSSQEYIDSFFMKFKDFASDKISYENYPMFKKQEKDIVQKAMFEVLYHNLPKVREMYRNILNIKFPSIAVLSKLVKNRHDLVHRNGFDVNGNRLELAEEDVLSLLSEAEQFIDSIEKELSNVSDSASDVQLPS